jgi:hypothetical protein
LCGGRQLRNWRQSCKRDFLLTLHWIRCVADEKSESFIPLSILLNAKPFYKAKLIYGEEITWSEGFLPDMDYRLSGMDPVRKVMIVLK